MESSRAPGAIVTATEKTDSAQRPQQQPQAGASALPPSPASTATLTDADRTEGEEEHVDVRKAEDQFEQLRRQLSRHSSQHVNQTGQRDIEKEAGSNNSSQFDLLAYLQGEVNESDEAGLKRKALGVSWEKLRVVGAGGEKMHIQTFFDACRDWALYPVYKVMQLSGLQKETPRNLLVEFDGCLKPGEMCLVLGRPGSGCTTFLKTIANNRGGYLSVEGDVSYGGIPASEMAKRYRGEVVYNQEDDVHAASLTVAQTLLFALSLKSPGKKGLPETKKGRGSKSLEGEVMEILTRMLGINHVKDSKVGNAHIRGVSGGERKRVSIAEMMATRATVCSWDNSTRGLDASTALDYAKALRVLTDVHQMSTFVSLYQAGEGIYEQFDKVLVIDQGRQCYFGPAKEARQYMMSLGYADLRRQTSADYLTGCTDPNERKLAPGRSEANVPTTPDQLAAAYKESEIYRRMVDERERYRADCERDERAREDFKEAVRTDKRRGSRKKSPYTASFVEQVWALTKRQMLLTWQDKVDLAVVYANSLVIALITGSVFYQLPTTAAGAFTRGGALFIGIIFNGFEAFVALPHEMTGRPVTWKHGSYALYRPSATTLAVMLADLPNNLARMFIFSAVLYWMVGLHASAGAFFSYYITVVATFLATSSVFRFFGTVTSNYDQANRWTCLIVTFFELLSGYLIPMPSQHRYVFWISYLNPFYYGHSAALINEFKRLTFTCDGPYIFPNSLSGELAQYPTSLGPNQVCTVAGSTPGSSVIPGMDYLHASYGYTTGIQWRNFGILVAYFLVMSVVQAICAEYMPDGNTIPRVNVYARQNAKRRKLNAELEKNKEAYRKGEVEQDLSGLIQTRKPFTWENLTYTVPVPGGHRQLLDHVFGYVRPGQLTALMGSSGAGKTTLLDVLANRKTVGVIGGDRLVAGRPPGREFQRGAAYVEQQDVHDGTATVREAFRFSAYLRQPASVPKEEKDRYVEEVIQLLELEDMADAMIGFPGLGLDVEARKRVTIGVELASKPQLLLFLDEPTSGLDGQSAYNIVRFLRKLAAAGQAILVTIHQPNAMLFENFDRLLLLKSGGRTVYFGDIGKDSHVLREYLARNGAVCPDNANPAEYMLEAIGAGSSRQVGKKDWADRWNESHEFETVKHEIAQLKEEGLAIPERDDPSLQREYATSIWTQLQVVGKRALIAVHRSPDYTFTRVFNAFTLALIMLLVYLQLGNSQSDLQYRVFAIFYLVVLPAILIAQVVPMFLTNRETYVREASSKTYSSIAFAVGQLVAEVPTSILCSIIFFVIYYYGIGFQTDSDRAGYAYLMILLLIVYSITLGQVLAAISPNEYVGEMAVPPLLVVFTLFCGVTIPPNQLMKFWRSWLYWLNPFTYVVEGTMTNEMHGLQVECTANELRTFTPPIGQTCLDWVGPYLGAATGYLVDPNATSDCQYCQYANGDEYAASYDWSFGHRWRNIGIFIAYVVFNVAVCIAAARFLTFRYSRR
ncbi:hypothetical protein JCM8097_003859 [Rhodosporidiobolus ruineniae]